ncbi:hypothetical protein ACFE04_030111 [Oxalis oulophora]
MSKPYFLFGETPKPSSSQIIDDATKKQIEMEEMIRGLHSPLTVQRSLCQLARETNDENLAPMLWSSFGVITVLLQEIISIYQVFASSKFSHTQTTRICQVLTLVKCLLSHPCTMEKVISAHIPFYIFPLMKNESNEKQYDLVKLSALGVVADMAKTDNKGAINYLIDNDVTPYILKCMENGSKMSKLISTYIMSKLLSHTECLENYCAFADRLFSVLTTLHNMVGQLHVDEEPSKDLLKFVINCYEKLSEHYRARDALRNDFPLILIQSYLARFIYGDPVLEPSWRRCCANMRLVRHQPDANKMAQELAMALGARRPYR